MLGPVRTLIAGSPVKVFLMDACCGPGSGVSVEGACAETGRVAATPSSIEVHTVAKSADIVRRSLEDMDIVNELGSGSRL